jgi:hypothetical protein
MHHVGMVVVMDILRKSRYSCKEVDVQDERDI